MSCLKFKIARDISYIYTVESTQIIFVAVEVLFCGEMVILRTLLRICGAGARVRINVQTDCHTGSEGIVLRLTRRPPRAYARVVYENRRGGGEGVRSACTQSATHRAVQFTKFTSADPMSRASL